MSRYCTVQFVYIYPKGLSKSIPEALPVVDIFFSFRKYFFFVFLERSLNIRTIIFNMVTI